MTPAVSLLTGPEPASLPFEIVERKGLGHPDTICDALAEHLSVALSRAYLARFGTILHHNVDKKLIEDVTNDLTADTSALFVLGTGNASAVVSALEPYKGKVYQTTLDPEAEAQIQAALDRGEEGKS